MHFSLRLLEGVVLPVVEANGIEEVIGGVVYPFTTTDLSLFKLMLVSNPTTKTSHFTTITKLVNLFNSSNLQF